MDTNTTHTGKARATEETSAVSFARRALVVASIVSSVVLVLLFVWYTADLLMLVFAGVLVSVLLHGFSRVLRRLIPVSPAAALAFVSIALIAVIIGIVWFATAHIASQLSELWQLLPLALEHLSGYLARYPWAQ